MPNYNSRSVFAVDRPGVTTNAVDDLIFFEDINKDQLSIWNEFERIMASGDYDAAQDFIQGYSDVHGYFGNLYNLMVNRIKAAQDFLILNRTNIEGGDGWFSRFKKPKIFVYKETPTGVLKDQVWIGPSDYFADSTVKESINKLKITWPTGNSLANGNTQWGLTIEKDSDGYLTINGTCEKAANTVRYIILGDTTSPDIVTNADVWSWWNYYVSGSVPNYSNGKFIFEWNGSDGTPRKVEFNSNRTANMHANFVSVSRSTRVTCFFAPIHGEVYDNLKVGFMVCKTKETSPNQKFVKYGA